MRAWIARAMICGHLMLVSYVGSSYAWTMTLYSTPQEAKKHCHRDEVVWLNTCSGIWHEKGSSDYGHTEHGGYVCKKEAENAGNRASMNG